MLTCRVDSSSRLRVRTHPYSLPVALVEPTVEVHLHAQQLEVFYRGRRVASHPRLPGRFGARLRLDPYLERLPVKPGALVNARARHQARESGQWPAQDDRLFAELKPRYGDTHGTRQRRPVLLLHRDHEAVAVHPAVVQALALGCRDAGALAVLGRPQGAAPAPPVGVTDLGALARYGHTISL